MSDKVQVWVGPSQTLSHLGQSVYSAIGMQDDDVPREPRAVAGQKIFEVLGANDSDVGADALVGEQEQVAYKKKNDHKPAQIRHG